MPVEIFGTPVFHESITGPSNTDDTDGPSVADPCTQLQDNCKWLRRRTRLVGSAGTLIVPLVDASDDPITLDIRPSIGDPIVTLDLLAGDVVQMAFNLGPLVDFEDYTARLVLYEPTGPITIKTTFPAEGVPASPTILFATHTIVTPGTYTVQLELSPNAPVSRGPSGHNYALNVTINEGNQ